MGGSGKLSKKINGNKKKYTGMEANGIKFVFPFILSLMHFNFIVNDGIKFKKKTVIIG